MLRRRVAKGGIKAAFFIDKFDSYKEMEKIRREKVRDQIVQSLMSEEREKMRQFGDADIRYYPGQYAGVLVDTVRHYWSLQDLKNVIEFLGRVDGLNLLHLRVSDDQGFVIQLDSHPELATSIWRGEDEAAERAYTADEMRNLVTFAKTHGVYIMPELDLPGHAGGWHRSGLLVDCPEYICETV